MDHPEKQQAIRLINFSVNDVNMHIGMPASDEIGRASCRERV